MIILKNIIGILTDPKNTRMFLLGGIVVLCILLFRQCEETEIAKGEVTRIDNNWKASLDTIQNYIDENGNAAAQIRALDLSLEELENELKFEKGKPPITVIKTETIIKTKICPICETENPKDALVCSNDLCNHEFEQKKKIKTFCSKTKQK